MKAKKAKFKFGQVVRCVNEVQPKTVTGITENSGYFYDVERYGGNTTLRVAEAALVDFKTGK
jgi:hypothetical protein